MSAKHNDMLSNSELAEVLEEIAQRLRQQAANPFRIAAYRAAAETIRSWHLPLAVIFERDRRAGLEKLPGVGKSIARKLGELLRRGRLRSLESLRRKQAAGLTLTSLPMIGPKLAERIRTTLGIESLEEVYAAAFDGRLGRIAGVGRKRVQAICECLAVRLNRNRRCLPPGHRLTTTVEPPVAVLLEIDRLYRERAASGKLLQVAPRRFNPTGAAWLPIMRITRHGHSFCVMFANTARCHQLGHTHDWVVIYREAKATFALWTIVTARCGALAGQRIIRGRERECRQYYQSRLPIQLSWLTDPSCDESLPNPLATT